MTVQAQVRRAYESPGAWLYEVIAQSTEEVENRVEKIASDPNVIGAVSCPIVEFGDRDYRTRVYVFCRLHIVE